MGSHHDKNFLISISVDPERTAQRKSIVPYFFYNFLVEGHEQSPLCVVVALVHLTISLNSKRNIIAILRLYIA